MALFKNGNFLLFLHDENANVRPLVSQKGPLYPTDIIKICYSTEPRDRRYVKAMDFYLLLKILAKT